MLARRWRRLALAAAGAVAAAGCSLGFHPSDYEDDTAQPDAAPARDGGRALDATLLDATLADAADGSLADGSLADGSVLRFCETVDATFCADFDDGSVIEGWNGAASPSSGLGTRVVDFSPPSPSLEVTLPAVEQDASDVNELLQQTFATPAREVKLSFDMSIAQLSGSNVTFVSLLYTRDQTEGVYLELADNSTVNLGLYVAPRSDNTAWTYSDVPGVDSGGVWNHFDIDMLPLPGGAGRVDVRLDGVVAQSIQGLDFVLDGGPNTLQLTVGLGHRDATVSPALNVHFDNVVLSFP